MPNTQLFKLLAIIDKKEMAEFGHYLKGVHSRKKRFHKIHEYLMKFHPDYDVPEMARDEVIKFVYDNPVRGGTLSNLYNLVYEQLELFLAIKEMNKEPFVKDYLLIRNLASKKKEKLFQDKIKEARANLEKYVTSNGLNVFYFFKQQLLHHLSYFYTNDASSLIKESNNEVQYAQLHLEKYYTLAMLSYDTELLNRKRIYKYRELRLSMNSYKYKIILNLYKLKTVFLGIHKLGEYFRLKNFFIAHVRYLSDAERNSTLIYLFNFAMKNIKEGNLIFTTELFNLYKFSFNEKLMNIREDVSPVQFLNIINAAAAAAEFSWAENFIKEYEETTEDVNAVRLANAQLLFERKEYEKVTDCLIGFTHGNLYLQYRAKTLYLRSSYMLSGDDKYVWDFYRAFLAIVSRNENINIKVKESYLNFLNYFRIIFLDKKQTELVISELQKIENIQCRKWLLEVCVKD